MSRDSKHSSPDSINRIRKIFYDHGADGKIKFNDGEVIKVNKGMLASHSVVFDEVFFGETINRDEYHVTDFDSSTFKIFLDCLMGFKPYTVFESLQIFPIAFKYQTEDSLKKCIETLKPQAISQTVCHTLKMALFYDCNELIDNIINFLKEKFNIILLLETKEYSALLEPIALSKLLENVEVDFYLIKIICVWAEDYIRKSNKLVNIGWFLIEHKILEKLLKIRFESVKSMLDFCKFNDTANIFTSKQISTILQNNMSIDYPRKFPNDSAWVAVRKGETFTESFTFTKLLCFSDIKEDVPLCIQVTRNEFIFMDTINQAENSVNCLINFSFLHSKNVRSFLYSNQNNQYSFNEHQTFKKGKKSVYEIKMPLSLSFFCLNTLEVTYTFNVDCRILKTSLDPTFVDETKSLYHTYDVTGQLSVDIESGSDNMTIDSPVVSEAGSVKNEVPVPTW